MNIYFKKSAVILLSILIFSMILSLDISVEKNSTRDSKIKRVKVPEDPHGNPIQFNAITERKVIEINLIRLIIGMVLGMFIGTLLSKKISFSEKSGISFIKR